MKDLSLLIIDDDTHLLKMMTSVCRMAGLKRTETAEGGPEAIRKFKEKGPFDLIMCDYRMPEIDGVSLIDEIRKIDPNVAVLFTTGAPDTQVVLAAVQKERTALLPKPFAVKEFQAKLEELTKE